MKGSGRDKVKAIGAGLLLLAFTGNARGDSETELRVSVVAPPVIECIDSTVETTTCFLVESKKNITHIFLAFDLLCEEAPPQPPDPFVVTVNGTPVPAEEILFEDDLHDK